MCGIAGIIDLRNRDVDPALIRRMTGALSHRGPDADGFYGDPGMAFGHRRLSIIDLSPVSDQPLIDNTGRYIMVFNGEIYNYREIRATITDYAWRTNGDGEVLLASYIKRGAACLDALRGMYAFVIWDRQEKVAFMARDRMGVKPLYYARQGEVIAFASEVRSVLEAGLTERRISSSALLEYFSFQSVSHPLSMVDGIRQLEAGSWMRIKAGQTETGKYWEVTDRHVEFDFSDRSAVQERIRELMLQSVRRRLVADVPVGAFLSGGIDSSAVVGLMAEAGSQRPNTFNISFEEEKFDESEYAEMVAKKFNTNHTKLLLKPTVFLDELENGLDALDSPSGDGINTYVVSKAIRQHGMTVALSGVGGDELFAGYPFFHQYLGLQGKSWMWSIPAGMREMMGKLLLMGQPAGKRGRMLQLLGAGSPSIVDTYPVFRQIISPSLMRKLTRLLTSGVPVTAVQQALRSRKEAIDQLPLLSQVSVAEYLGYTQHTLLKDTDQMGMAVTLEIREPFFDQDLVEFVLAIPDEIKKPTYPKSLLVESLKPLLPDEIVHRKKQGFLFPWEVWLKNDLRKFCDERIKNMADRSFVNGGVLVDWWRKFLAGDPTIRWAEPWLFVVLEHWLEKNNIS